MSLVIGIDIGGTFTDCCVYRVLDARRFAWKTPTDRTDPSASVLEAITGALAHHDLPAADVVSVTLGHTVALNAILERSGGRLGLLVTGGHRDLLEIARERRHSLYDLQQDKLPLLVERHRTFEIDERLDAEGRVVRPLDPATVDAALDRLTDLGVDAVAVSFLHAYAEPAHERQALERIATRRPDLAACASHQVHPQYREYERTQLTVLNAYAMTATRGFVDDLVRSLAELTPAASLAITDAAGGAMNVRAARDRAVHSALSGPAAGVRGAIRVAGAAQTADFVTFDMGGTSCDVAVVRGGEPTMTRQGSLGGYPFPLRTVDVHSISAGGGTLAWVDSGGLLRVGPGSTGADPGPAAYGRGGRRPTITDAHLVLGHLDPQRPLGDRIHLDVDAAWRAIADAVAGPMGMTVPEAAAGIVAIADAAMVRAIEVVSIEHGHDARELVLLAFGGAAPLHATSIARTMGITRVIVPLHAGTLCAFGAVCCDERYELTRSLLVASADADARVVEHAFDALEVEARALLGRPGAPVQVRRSLDLRYVGQTAALEVPIEPGGPGIAGTHELFVRRYEDQFGYVMPERPTEIENVRVTLVAGRTTPRLAPSRGDQDDGPGPARWRAHFGANGFLDALRYDVRDLRVGAGIRGPAVVVAEDSTALLHPGQRAQLDGYRNLVIDVGGDAADAGAVMASADAGMPATRHGPGG